jgi:soluble lytic murein transglycosylase-like protein
MRDTTRRQDACQCRKTGEFVSDYLNEVTAPERRRVPAPPGGFDTPFLGAHVEERGGEHADDDEGWRDREADGQDEDGETSMGFWPSPENGGEELEDRDPSDASFPESDALAASDEADQEEGEPPFASVEGEDALDRLLSEAADTDATDDERLWVSEEEETASPAALPARIAAIANAEWERWDKGRKKETDPAVTKQLQDYYAIGVKRSVSARDLQNRAWQYDHPWSAVFISYVMRQAGAGDAFEYASAHATYVAAAKRARQSGLAWRFWAYRINEVAPMVGDLVCRDRRLCEKCRCAGVTYESLERGGKTHCDIVVGVDRAKNRIRVIGGNVNQSVDEKFIALDANGHLPASARRCQYIAVIKPPDGAAGRAADQGAESQPAPSSALAKLPAQLAAAVRKGTIGLPIGLAILGGERNVNTLTNRLFAANHPELPAGHKIQPHEKALASDWLRLRDEVIKPLLRTLSLAPGTPPPASTSKVGDLSKVERWADLSRPIAEAHGVSPAFVLGLIAAESGGDPAKQAKSGYRGLMQAQHRDEDPQGRQFDPTVSITTGVKKLADFRGVLDKILRKHGKTFSSLPRDEGYKLLALSYNAGPVSIAKALEYAAAAGNPSAWSSEEHYQRALLFTGAFSTGQAAGKCLAGLDPSARQAAIRAAETERGKWRFKNRCKNWRDCSDPPAWAEVAPQLTALTRCAIAFKMSNTPRFWNMIRRYIQHFES